MNVCCAICALELTSSQMSRSILLSYIVAPFVALAAWLMPAATGLVLFSVLSAVAVRLTWGVAGPFLAEAEGHEAPADFSATQPSTFLSFGSQVFGVFFLMRVAFGYALRIDTAPFADAAFLIPAVGMYAWVTRHAGRPFPADLLTRASVLFVVAGYYLAGVTGGSLRAVSIPLFYMGSALFDIVVWAVLLAAGQRQPPGGGGNVFLGLRGAQRRLGDGRRPGGLGGGGACPACRCGGERFTAHGGARLRVPTIARVQLC